MPKPSSPLRRGLVAAFALLTVATAAGLPQHAAATPVTGGGFTTDARPSATVVSRGGALTLRVDVTSATSRRALVDLEVYTGSGVKAHQQAWDAQSFVAGQRRTFTSTWTVAANAPLGTYYIKIGMFGPGWNPFLHWNDVASSVRVTAAPAATTTTRPATTTTLRSTTTTTRPTSTTTRPTSTTTRPTTTTTRPPTTTTTIRPTTTTIRPTTTTIRPTTTTIRPTTTTIRPTTTTIRPTTTTTPPPTGHFSTLPVGAALPSDATCAALVRPAAEIRPANNGYNQTRGTQLQSSSPIYSRVTGNFVGTTDEIIQWTACKWGIDEDIVRAQTVKESWWFQRTGGDFTTDPSRCAPDHGMGVDGRPGQCAESVGVQQVRYPYHGIAFPTASRSTALNLDYAMATRRNCFEGYETWLNQFERGRDYAAGDMWGCVGLWFSGRWYTPDSVTYLNDVQSILNQRIWETPNFINAT